MMFVKLFISYVGKFSTTQLMMNNNFIQSQERQPAPENVKCNCLVTLTSADPCKKNYVNMQEKIANMQANYV